MKQRLGRQQECGHQDQSRVGYVDSAREENEARAVVEIYLKFDFRSLIFGAHFRALDREFISGAKKTNKCLSSSCFLDCRADR